MTLEESIRELDKELDTVQDDGWYVSSTREKYLASGIEMLEAGMERDNVISILTRLYWAAAEEFGG